MHYLTMDESHFFRPLFFFSGQHNKNSLTIVFNRRNKQLIWFGVVLGLKFEKFVFQNPFQGTNKRHFKRVVLEWERIFKYHQHVAIHNYYFDCWFFFHHSTLHLVFFFSFIHWQIDTIRFEFWIWNWFTCLAGIFLLINWI